MIDFPSLRHTTSTDITWIKDLRSNITARQKLESQQQENKGVQKVCDYWDTICKNDEQQKTRLN